jgi:YD repeat-containing protein
MRRKLAAFLIAMALVLPIGVAAQQGGTTFYVYDANGRLSVVIAPSGAAAVYQYDAAGNFTSISQIPATTLQVYGFNPASGGAGDQVTIFGTGFGAGSGITAVSFNGTAATIVSSYANSVIATVPSGATTGPISVTNSTGTATSAASFAIVSRVRIVPGAATLLEGQSFQFTDFDSVPGDTGVTWSVSGITGGNSTVGTVSTAGLYKAPNQTSNSIVVTVTSNLQPVASASAQVTVVNASLISHLYSSVSVQVGEIVGGNLPVRAPSVSVQLGQFVGGSVSDYSAAVSVTTGPVISGISPTSLKTGTTGTSLTISGQNLAAVTAIVFIDSNGVDTNITASSVSANPNGTSVTASVATGSGAALGQHTVVVVAGSLSSPIAAYPSAANTIQVTH